MFQSLGKLSLSEFRWFVQQGAEGLFTDYPEDPVWRVIELTASDGRTAYWSQWVYGASWEGIDIYFLGAATTAAAARKMVKRYCYVDVEDLARRYPTALADVSESVREPVEDDQSPHGQHRKQFAHKQFIDGFVRWKRLCYAIESSIGRGGRVQ